MTDTVSPEARSRIMARVKSKGMKPEMQVRRLLHGLGYRYRLHRADLPGRPDLVFPSRRKVVFVNGCFWHRHDGCPRVRIPATNRDYWIAKLERNHARDARNLDLLEEQGWTALTVWECELHDLPTTTEKMVAFLGRPGVNHLQYADSEAPRMTTIAAPPKTETTRRLFTVAEYMAMGEAGILHEDEHVELLAGEIIQMAAIGNRHLFCTDSLTTLMVPALVGRAIVRVQGSIQLDDYGMPEPDIVLLRPRPDYHAETAKPEDVLLLIEVADSSLEFDYGPKSEFYAAAGIPEFWIANLRTGEVEARTDPVGAEYTTVRTIPADGAISPQSFPDLVLQLSEFMPPANA